MQMTLFRKITEVIPRIEFECTVEGRELTAAITHKEDTGVQLLYHVTFSDGHQDIYAPGDEEVHEGIGRTRTLDAYEEAVFEDLCVIPVLAKGKSYTCIRVHEEGGDSFNVWVRERNGFYSAYYKGQYQFTLRKPDQWLVSTMRGKGYAINYGLARLVAKHLDEQER